jgi:lipopolysaccharide transport system ATP-binding protein
MSSNAPTIKVSDLSKCYTIYDKPVNRLKQSIVPKILGVLGMPSKLYYREFWALHGVTLDIRKGETVGVIGRNGSGKSTLLQMICGTLTPTSGKIETNGRITALLELGSGFNPEFTGRENVFLNGAILGLRQDEIEARFDAIADFADIGDFIEQPVKFYSSGMMVRLAFAVQAMVDPDILIVDEALAVGDERFQRKCFLRLEELKNNGTSILFVSHAGQQIIEMCDRALLLEQGQRLLFSDPLTVVRAYQKMIYANPTDQARLILEYKELDREGIVTVKLPAGFSSDRQSSSQAEPSTLLATLSDENSHLKVEEKIQDTDFYEAGMIPQTTEFYPIQGARIDSIKIYNSKGNVVNNLLAGQEYGFEIRGAFLEDRESVRIGLHIRTRTDLEITGQSYPGVTKHMNSVKRGQRFRLVHKMRMSLLPNTYFAGGGIWSTTEPVCMHRVIDAIMFCVIPKAERRSFGYVDLSTGEPEFEIIEG